MRILARIAYDGSKYLGFQRLNNGKGIQNEIEEVLSEIAGEEVLVHGSGRTDAGVHAIDQCVHFDFYLDISLEKLKYIINRNLSDGIVVKSLEEVSSDFHARRDVLKKRLLEFNNFLNIQIINSYLENDTLYKFKLNDVDLIINCADFPNVDITSEIVSSYCMKYSINHIIAGGYNKHVSLLGQTIIPFQTACYKCFDIQLKNRYNNKMNQLKKLIIPDRKIGSFGPMCTISASLSSLDAIKILSKLIPPTNINKRGEFDIYKMDINYLKFDKLNDCPWCGVNGIYTKKALL